MSPYLGAKSIGKCRTFCSSCPQELANVTNVATFAPEPWRQMSNSDVGKEILVKAKYLPLVKTRTICHGLRFRSDIGIGILKNSVPSVPFRSINQVS